MPIFSRLLKKSDTDNVKDLSSKPIIPDSVKIQSLLKEIFTDKNLIDSFYNISEKRTELDYADKGSLEYNEFVNEINMLVNDTYALLWSKLSQWPNDLLSKKDLIISGLPSVIPFLSSYGSQREQRLIMKEFINMAGGQKPLVEISKSYESIDDDEIPEEQENTEEISGLDYNTPQMKYLEDKGLQKDFIDELVRSSVNAKDYVFDAIGDLFAKPSGESLDKRYRFFVYNPGYLSLHINQDQIAKDIKDAISSSASISKLLSESTRAGVDFKDFKDFKKHPKFFNSLFERLLPKYSKTLDDIVPDERANQILNSRSSDNILEIYQAIFQKDIDNAIKIGDISKSEFFQIARKISISKMNIAGFGDSNTQSFDVEGRDGGTITVEEVGSGRGSGNVKDRQEFRADSGEQEKEDREYLVQSLKVIFYDKTEQLRNYAKSCADHIEGLALDSLEESKYFNEEFKKDVKVLDRFYPKDIALREKVSNYYRDKIIFNIDNANAKFSQSDYFRILGEAAFYNADKQFNEIKDKDIDTIRKFINKIKNKNYIQSSLRSLKSFYSFSQKLSKNRISILEAQEELFRKAYETSGSFNEAVNRSGPEQVAALINSKREKPFSEDFITSVLNRPLTDIDIQKMLQKTVINKTQLTEEDIKKISDYAIRNLSRNGYLNSEMFTSEASKGDLKRLRRKIAEKVLYQYNTFYSTNVKSIPSLEHLVPNAAIGLLSYVGSEDEGFNSQLRRDLLNLTNYHVMHIGGDQRASRNQTANFSLITEVGSRIDKTQEPIQIREGLYRTRITRPETLYLMYGLKMPKFVFDEVNNIYMSGRRLYDRYSEFKKGYDKLREDFTEKGQLIPDKFIKSEISYKSNIGNMISDKEYNAFIETWKDNIAETAIVSFDSEGNMVKDETNGAIKREVPLTKEVLIFMHKNKNFSPIEKTAFSVIENIFNKYASKIEKLVSINKKLNKEASIQHDINNNIKGILEYARREFESIRYTVED